jgi:hypothetical protein
VTCREPTPTSSFDGSLAISPDAWVLDGAYGLVCDLVWRQATHLVWLDYERRVIMYRVIRRSSSRATLRTEMWAGNRERWSHLLRPSHPIRWAWNTWHGRRRQFEERLRQNDYTHLIVLRLRRPREAKALLRLLKQTPGPERLDRVAGGLLKAAGRRARSSAGEHTLHTGGVTGSIPVAPTSISSIFAADCGSGLVPEMTERDANTLHRLAPAWHRCSQTFQRDLVTASPKFSNGVGASGIWI